ncbi:flagellar basal body P-ring biosynthesis protein FlgA [Thermincola ferriacetica]|uniref:Flagellar basal body P-ring biosynthesis protein FlgA n=1 Tax=Thermincola ferriacetica TaxID=281456 RepID=A0A0L6W4Q3_9FIRM|nr:SAF domain-containing protein [Thermincola ferriacetica]KNZ70363.1 flagellar basal body P-ring biosynthesis protein FlgA [Thermincola ferriacetica]
MFKSKVIKLAFIVFILLLGAGVMASQAMYGKKNVVVAKTRIAAGAEIQPGDVEVKSVSNTVAVPGAATSPEQVVGKQAMSERLPGDMIYTDYVQDKKDLPLGPETGLITVPVTETETKYLHPGSVVSVVTWKPSGEGAVYDNLAVVSISKTEGDVNMGGKTEYMAVLAGNKNALAGIAPFVKNQTYRVIIQGRQG